VTVCLPSRDAAAAADGRGRHPVPTALVAEHLHDAGAAAAVVTYGLVMIAMSFGFAGLWLSVVSHAGQLGAGPQQHALRSLVPA
jgi:hypothetical protein